MIGISKKVENAVISVLSAQTELESIEVIRGKEAVTHATFPRVVVALKDVNPLIPGQANPFSGTLELTVQTEAKVDDDGEICEDFADTVASSLLPPNGVNAVNAVAIGVKLHKIEFNNDLMTGAEDDADDSFDDDNLQSHVMVAEVYISRD
jgi:hypothetical protein